MRQDPDPVKITITTVSDTTGVEEAQKFIMDLGETANTADPQLDRLIGIERAKVAAQVAQAIGQIGIGVRGLANDLRDTDKELAGTLDNTATALDSATGALAGAAQGFAVGGPFGAAVGALGGALAGPFKEALHGMIEDLGQATEAEKRAAEMTVRLQEARAAFVERVRNENIRSVFDGETKAIDNTVAALEKKARLESAKRGADDAISKAFGPASAPEQKIDSNLSRQITEIDAEVQKASDLAKLAGDKALLAMRNAAEVANAQGETSQAAIAAGKGRDAAVKQADTLQARAMELQEASVIEKQQLTAVAGGELRNLADGAAADFTRLATEARDAMNDAAEKEGSKLPFAAKSATEHLTEMLTDNIPDTQQVARIKNAMEAFRVSQIGVDDTVSATMANLIKNGDRVIGLFTSLSSKVDFQASRIRDLESQMH